MTTNCHTLTNDELDSRIAALLGDVVYLGGGIYQDDNGTMIGKGSKPYSKDTNLAFIAAAKTDTLPNLISLTYSLPFSYDIYTDHAKTEHEPDGPDVEEFSYENFPAAIARMICIRILEAQSTINKPENKKNAPPHE